MEEAMGLTQQELMDRKVLNKSLATIAGGGAAAEVGVGTLPFDAYLCGAWLIPETTVASDNTNFSKIEVVNKLADGSGAAGTNNMAISTSKATVAVGTSGGFTAFLPWVIGSDLNSLTATGVGSLLATQKQVLPFVAPANFIKAFSAISVKVTPPPATLAFPASTLVLFFSPAPSLANQNFFA